MEGLRQKVENALAEIRPFLHGDGGDVSLESIQGTTVRVRFHGACVGCKVSDFTLRGGIENTIKKYAPEVEEVVAIDGE